MVIFSGGTGSTSSNVFITFIAYKDSNNNNNNNQISH